MADLETNSLIGVPSVDNPTALILDEQDSSGKTLADFFTANGYSPALLKTSADLNATPACQLANVRIVVLSCSFPGFETRRDRCRIFEIFPMTPVISVGPPDEKPEEDAGATAVRLRLDRPLSPDALARALRACRRFSEALDEALQRQLFLGHSQYLEEPLARILHDLNNQITGLRGGSDLLNYAIAALQDPEGQAKIKRYMEQFIHPSVAQIEQMVHVWRALRQSRLASPAPSNLMGVVQRGIRLAADPFQQGRIRIALRGREMGVEEYSTDGREPDSGTATSKDSPEPVLAFVNPAHLSLAVAHAVQNALEAVEELPEGRILVTVDPAEEGMCRIEVHDNGSGIPEADRPLIWKAFHSTKGRNRNGLGLAVAKQVVDKYQGRISCATSPLGGACIRILVPAASGEEELGIENEEFRMKDEG